MAACFKLMFVAKFWNTWTQIAGRTWYIGTERNLWLFLAYQYLWSTERLASTNKKCYCGLAGTWKIFLNLCAFHYHTWRFRYAADEHYVDYVFVSEGVMHGFQSWFWMGLIFTTSLHLLLIFVINKPSFSRFFLPVGKITDRFHIYRGI
jgi:hypothetical protein